MRRRRARRTSRATASASMNRPLAPVVGHDAPVLAHALGHVLVRREDDDPLDAPDRRRSGPRPHPAHRRPRTRPSARRRRRARAAPPPTSAELGEQLRRHAGLGLVARVPVVAPGADDVVGGAAEVRDAVLAEERERRLSTTPSVAPTGGPSARRRAVAARSGRGTARRSRRGGGSARAGHALRRRAGHATSDARRRGSLRAAGRPAAARPGSRRVSAAPRRPRR